MIPDEAEAGSAEEQPVRNNPVRYASVFKATGIAVAIFYECISVHALTKPIRGYSTTPVTYSF